MFSKFQKLFSTLTDRERRIFQNAVLVLILSLILNGANIFYRATILSPIEGGSYLEGVVGQPIAVNPLVAAQNEVDRDLVSLLFSPLKDLAEQITPDEDQTTWTIRLPEELSWSDGEPLTADDIVFTIESIQNPDAGSPLLNAWQGVTAERVSAQEARITLKTPYAFFGENLNSLIVAPHHIFGSIPLANLRLSDYNLEPVGSGPYAFVNYEKRRDGFITRYHFVSNRYFKGERPLIKYFSFAFFGSYDDAIAAFNRREIHGLGGVSATLAENIRIAHELREFSLPRYYAVFFNPAASLELKDSNIRKALVRAIDRAEIIELALGGKGIPVDGPLHPNVSGYHPGAAAELMFSLEESAALLEKSGWKMGEDGVRHKTVNKEDRALEFQMVVPDIDFLTTAAKVLVDQWSTVGIRVELITLSPAEIANETIKNRSYQMVLFGNILKSTPDIFSFWHSSERFRSGLNLSFYENKTVDGLLESIRRELSESKRRALLYELQEEIADDAPAAFLFSPTYLYASPKTLGGFDTLFIENPSERFEHVEEWYLKTARTFK